MSAFDTNKVTLMYLANSIYQEEATKNEKNNLKEKKEEEKFYRKRVFSMIKNMMKGKYPSENIKKTHKAYIYTLIEHIKMQDRCDLLQADYPQKITNNLNKQNHNINILETIPEETDLSEADALLMSNTSSKKQPTLDDFVNVRKVIIKQEDPPPRLKNINIKTEDHKTKGLKKNKKPEKIKNDSDQTK